jgi:hypothetical protein
MREFGVYSSEDIDIATTDGEHDARIARLMDPERRRTQEAEYAAIDWIGEFCTNLERLADEAGFDDVPGELGDILRALSFAARDPKALASKGGPLVWARHVLDDAGVSRTPGKTERKAAAGRLLALIRRDAKAKEFPTLPHARRLVLALRHEFPALKIGGSLDRSAHFLALEVRERLQSKMTELPSNRDHSEALLREAARACGMPPDEVRALTQTAD